MPPKHPQDRHQANPGAKTQPMASDNKIRSGVIHDFQLRLVAFSEGNGRCNASFRARHREQKHHFGAA